MNQSPGEPIPKGALASPADDRELWELFKAGDRKAFSFIYQQHVQPLFGYGTKICSDAEVVEDCIQELFVYLWHTKENLGETDSIKYYLFKSLRRRILTYLAGNTKKNSFETAFASEAPVAEPSSEFLIIDDNEKDEQRAKLDQAMLHLTKRQREAIYLKFYDNLSFKEIAGIMEMHLKSTHRLIAKAIEVLRAYVQNIFLLVLISFPLPLC